MSEEITAGGAFVEFDKRKMTREEAFMLGCQETLDLWIETLTGKATSNAPNMGVARLLLEIAGKMKENRDGIAVELTRSGLKTGSATMHNAEGKRVQ